MRYPCGTYLGDNRVLILPQWGCQLLTFADDLSLTPALLADGLFDPGLTNYMMHNLKPGMTVLDIGANIGYFTILAASAVGRQGRVVAYEANPEFHALLADNIRINIPWADYITAVPQAVSDVNGELPFHVSLRYRGNSSLRPHSELYKIDFEPDRFAQITVDSVRLDDCQVVRSLRTKIDFAKIDIEGGEYRALCGMQGLIDAGRVKMMSLELNRSMLQDDVNPFHVLLHSYVERFNATFYSLAPDGTVAQCALDDLLKYDFLDNMLVQFPDAPL